MRDQFQDIKVEKRYALYVKMIKYLLIQRK